MCRNRVRCGKLKYDKEYNRKTHEGRGKVPINNFIEEKKARTNPEFQS